MTIKKSIKRQFQVRKFLFRHDEPSDFYLSCFQRSKSTIPLLLARTLICAGCLAIWIASMVLTSQYIPMKYWPIYMTHWGLIINTFAAGFGVLVSVMAYVRQPNDDVDGLSWYVQTYWVLFNLSVPIAFFISIFYWTLLSAIDQDFAINFTLDILIHGINSVLMFALLLCSRHPCFFLHFYVSIGFGFVYLIFTYIYYISGGTDALGNHTIYPMLDWEKPGQTMIMMVVCVLGIIILHGLVVALSALRDLLSRRFRKETTAYDIHDAYY